MGSVECEWMRACCMGGVESGCKGDGPAWRGFGSHSLKMFSPDFH